MSVTESSVVSASNSIMIKSSERLRIRKTGSVHFVWVFASAQDAPDRIN